MIYVLGLGLVGIAWLLPGHYFPWTSFHQEALSATGVAVIALAAIASPREWLARVPSPAVFAALLSLVPVLQYVAGEVIFHSDAFLSSAYLLAFALAVIAGRQLSAPADCRFVLSMYVAVMSAGLISTGLGLVQWLHLGPAGFVEHIDRLERVSANMRQPNQLATLLALAVVSILWLYESHRIRGAVALLALSFIGFGMVMTQSRTGWLFVLGFGVVWLVFRRQLQLLASPAAVWIAVATFFLIALGWGELNHWLLMSDDVSMAARLQPGRRGVIWQTVIDAALRSPWIGYGWQQMPLAQLAVAQDHVPINYWLTSGHNVVLDLLIWNGIPIGLTVTGAVAWWFISRARACRDLDVATLLVSLGVFGLHSMFELPLHYAYYLLPAGLMVGVIEARSRIEPGRFSMRLPRIGYAAVWVVLCIGLATVMLEYSRVEEATRRAGLRDVGYVQPGAPAEAPEVWLLDGPRELIRIWISEAHEGMTPAELDLMLSVSSRYPVPAVLSTYALAAGLNGRDAEARRTLNIFCRVSGEAHCVEGRANWQKAVKKFPRLERIDFPPTSHPDSTQ